MLKTGRAFWTQSLRDQEKWIRDRGGDRLGYRAHYEEWLTSQGRPVSDADFIFDADQDTLRKCQELAGFVVSL